jgi:hypothetical protein
MSESPQLPLSKNWPSRVESAMLHVISLTQFATGYNHGWASDSLSERLRLKAALISATRRSPCLLNHHRKVVGPAH